MEDEKMFYPEKREEQKNLLLESPELVSPEEERKQEGEMSFSFFSDTRRYYLGHKDGKSFYMVEYFDSCSIALYRVYVSYFENSNSRWHSIIRSPYRQYAAFSSARINYIHAKDAKL